MSLLAGCQTARPSPAVPTAPSRPTWQRITLANADRIRQVGEIDSKQGGVRGVAWAPAGHLLALAPNTQIQVWEIASMKRLRTLQGHLAQVNGLAWSPDGRLLASVSDDGTVRLWDPTAGRPRAVMGGQLQGNAAHPALSVAWSPESRRVVSGHQDGTVQVWDARTFQRLGIWTRPSLVNGAGDRLAVWGVAWSPDGLLIASNRYDTHVFLWEASTGRLLATLIPSAPPNGVAWSPVGRVLATTSDDGTVQLWDQANHNFRVLQGQSDAGWAYPVMWSPHGDLLAAVGRSGLVQVWESKTGRELTALHGHVEAVWSAAWSPDGLLIASGSDDETVRLWGVV